MADQKHSAAQIMVGLVLIVGIGIAVVWAVTALFSGDPEYVAQCRKLWQDRDGRMSPAIETSFKRVGSGEFTRRSDDRLVGYYTDFIITQKFDNFGKSGRINLQCAANSKKAFVFMKTDDRDWIGGRPGPSGVSYTLANGRHSPFVPDLD